MARAEMDDQAPREYPGPRLLAADDRSVRGDA
jgi:hypothetical protein